MLDILFISQIMINILINIIKISYFPWKLSRIRDVMDHSHLVQMLYYLMSMVLLNTKSYIILPAMTKLCLLLQLTDLQIHDMMDHSHLVQMLYYLMSMVLLSTKSCIILPAMMKLHLLLQLSDLHDLFQGQVKHIQLSPTAFYLVAMVHENHGTHFRTPKNLILLDGL